MNPELNNTNQLPEITYYTGILYHGAKMPIVFDKNYDYLNPNSTFDGSWTLGKGTYFTDSESGATEYSEVRQRARKEKQKLVYTAYMPDCKFLDFRGEHGNLPVTQDFTTQWRDYFKEYLDDLERISPITEPEYIDVEINGIKRRRVDRKLMVRNDLKEYLKYLNLRVLLGSVPEGELPKTDSKYEGGDDSPTWSTLFAEFMIIKQDVDGIIYQEGNEAPENPQSYTTFVVYNLDKVHFSENPMI